MSQSHVPSARTAVAGAGGGAVHLALVLALRDALGVAGLPTAGPVATAGAGYLLVGAVLVGALPVLLAVDRGVASPAAAVVGVLALAACRTWALDSASGPAWFDLYVVGWPVVLAVVVTLAVVEPSLRRAAAEPS